MAEATLRAFERPQVTRLSASGGEILVDRSDFPPESPRPGLPGENIHFNFVLLTALFALGPGLFRSESLARLLGGLVLLFAVHVIALDVQIESVYATHLGGWSAAHYGRVARNLWAGGFQFYEIVGRFAAPFAIWWLLGRRQGAESRAVKKFRGRKHSKKEQR